MEYLNIPDTELLKLILTHLQEPWLLNEHPWAARFGNKNDDSTGAQLAAFVSKVFRRMVPSSQPQQGKRLDTRWGVFGLLASMYFAPAILHSFPPGSQRDAWETMDDSILLLVFGNKTEVSPVDREKYRFAGNEKEPAPNSTLSDWHKKGLEQLTQMLILEFRQTNVKTKKSRKPFLVFSISLLIILTAAITVLGLKAHELYKQALVIKTDAAHLADVLSPNLTLAQIPEITTRVHALRLEIDSFEADVSPFLWLTAYSGWIPRYGGDISQAGHVVSLAQNLVTAADEGLTAVSPSIKTTLDNNKSLDVIEMMMQLQDASPQLLNAQLALASAQTARDNIDLEKLSPDIKEVITTKIDRIFQSIPGAFPMKDALTMVRAAPKLLGVGSFGPQTYLILIQNEDELRPTGGFITAGGSAIIMNGNLINLKFENSGLLDDFSKPYPAPPWQFTEFMNIDKLVFRDANWYTDFPRSALLAEYLYSYTRAASSDGIIAIDYHSVEELLKVLGPLTVEKVDYPITSDNVVEYMRTSKEPAPAGFIGEWDYKQYFGRIAKPLLEKILQARGQTWTKLLPVLLQLLNEKHIILQFDEPDAAALIHRRNWDGAVVIPENSDFQMVVDTNMGYNKSNAFMELSAVYSVNLENLSKPKGLLRVRQINHSQLEIKCEPDSTRRFTPPEKIPQSFYPMDECHWGYLRVYLPKGTRLLRSTPQAIPDTAAILGEAIPARTDDLGDEDIKNAQVYGAMVITPTKSSSRIEFEYSLPDSVLTFDKNIKTWTYNLKLQKQPGPVNRSFLIQIHLPAKSTLVSSNVHLSENNSTWSFETNLQEDKQIQILFAVK